jgi:hypothetical protein
LPSAAAAESTAAAARRPLLLVRGEDGPWPAAGRGRPIESWHVFGQPGSALLTFELEQAQVAAAASGVEPARSARGRHVQCQPEWPKGGSTGQVRAGALPSSPRRGFERVRPGHRPRRMISRAGSRRTRTSGLPSLSNPGRAERAVIDLRRPAMAQPTMSDLQTSIITLHG